jgi:hypothetical protein
VNAISAFLDGKRVNKNRGGTAVIPATPNHFEAMLEICENYGESDCGVNLELKLQQELQLYAVVTDWRSKVQCTVRTSRAMEGHA